MNKWVKRLIILLIVVILTIFFGSIVFSLLSYVADFMGVFMGWIGTALRWLAKLVDVFGFTGIFAAQADVQPMTNILNTTKIFIGGC